jgi:hypothetical protein
MNDPKPVNPFLPPGIQEDTGRGTEIKLRSDQLKVLGYLAQAGQSGPIGISFAVDQHQVEYWLRFQLYPIPDEPIEAYLDALNVQWQNTLSEMAPLIAQYYVGRDIEYTARTRYQSNIIRVWIMMRESFEAGIRPLAEIPVPRDRW